MLAPVADIRFAFTWRRYTVATADSAADRDAAFRLRHDVFLAEMLGHPLPEGVDVDEVDAQCLHLLVRDGASGDLVGTCRLNRGGAQGWYSAREFVIDALLAQPGVPLEIGRTCLRADHRNTLGLLALGRGVGRVAAILGARRLFGCASVAGDDVAAAARLCAAFRSAGLTAGSFGARPRATARLAGLEAAVASLAFPPDLTEVDDEMPPLLRAYLRGGAAVSAAPAHDPAFRCVDFLTVIDRERSRDNAFFGRLAPC